MTVFPVLIDMEAGTEATRWPKRPKRLSLFEYYYKNQGIVPDDEWDSFIQVRAAIFSSCKSCTLFQTLKTTLPITFHLNETPPIMLSSPENAETLRSVPFTDRMMPYVCSVTVERKMAEIFASGAPTKRGDEKSTDEELVHPMSWSVPAHSATPTDRHWTQV